MTTTPPDAPETEESEANGIAEAVEEIAGEKLGVEEWDRPGIFRESAAAATDNGLPYWLVLTLSGAIATLGLALDSSAVVIGAMLVAPLLAPVIGLGLSLAVGDGRLAVQTAAVVLGSTIAVIVVGALLTALLPFHTITAEISARTRPSTLDLVIAVFSGLVGAVVTVARGSRLSAAIPGVAISVALIPPLAVAGFGIGVGWNGVIIRGSLLLYGANLAGIVLSGMLVFLIVGMHRKGVLETVKRWHSEQHAHGLAALALRAPGVRSLSVFRSAWARIALVGIFVVALGVPLSETLAQITRETQVERAVRDAANVFAVPGRSSVLSRQVEIGSDRTQVYLRVATTEWFGQEDREEFERLASARAGEPVRLALEQVPARGEDLGLLTAMIPGRGARPVQSAPPPAPPRLPGLLASAQSRLRQAAHTLILPEGTTVIGIELLTPAVGATAATLVYTGSEPLARQAEQMIRGQLRQAVELPDMEISLAHISTAPRLLQTAGLDTVQLREVVAVLIRNQGVAAEILAPDEEEPAAAGAVVEWLTRHGINSDRVSVTYGSDLAVRLRGRALPPEMPQEE